MAYKIRKNVKIPPPKKRGKSKGTPAHNKGKFKHPFDKLNVGDSFLFEKGMSKSMAYQHAWRANSRFPGRKFKIGIEKGAIGVWRIL